MENPPGLKSLTRHLLGFNVETVENKGIRFNVWDVGGQDKIRPLWRHCTCHLSFHLPHVWGRTDYADTRIILSSDYENTQGIIYVVDSNDRERMSEAREELQRMLNEDELRDAILLVFANKRDLPNAMSAAEITDQLGLPGLGQRTWYVQVSVIDLFISKLQLLTVWISRPHVRPVEMACTKVSNMYVFGWIELASGLIIPSDRWPARSRRDRVRDTVFRSDWIPSCCSGSVSRSRKTCQPSTIKCVRVPLGIIVPIPAIVRLEGSFLLLCIPRVQPRKRDTLPFAALPSPALAVSMPCHFPQKTC